MKTLLLLFALLLACSALPLCAADTKPDKNRMPIFPKDARVLFQGDSITDGNRGRSADPNHILGHGYAFIIAAKYGDELAERNLEFINRGISGNTVGDLTNRWQKDTLDLKPDILSILVGINDQGRGVAVNDFEAQYDALLETTVKNLPNVKLILGEPFGLPTGNHKADWAAWSENLKARQAVVVKLAAKYHAPVVPFQKAFDEACLRAPAEHWIWDGVHPTYSGHQVMANAWIQTAEEFYGK